MAFCCGVGGLERKHILLVGLEDSGKTYLLYKLKIRHVDSNKLRKTLRDMKNNKDENRPKEFKGRGGLEPTRFGDWEVKGITSDF